MAACALAVACGDDSPTELPPASLEELFGDRLYRADGSEVGLEALEGVPVIGIYFGASGCPACSQFTPLLVAAYEEIHEAGRPFEVVYVSSDRNAPEMFDYMVSAGMGWLALPWRGDRAMALVERYEIRWIPTLVVIDGGGGTISLTGREEVTEKGAAAYEDWRAAVGD